MASRISGSDTAAFAQSGISRRNLAIVGGVAATGGVVGLGASLIFGNNAVQVGDGSGGATPPPSQSSSVGGTPTVAPTEVVAPNVTPDGTPTLNSADPSTLLDTASISDLREYLDTGSFTVSQLTRAALDRIRAVDGGEIDVNAMITLNAQAMDIAAELDAELVAGTIRGRLHGIPVVLKDIIATGDTMPNTAGALAMKENVADRDAWVAGLLREAGAVILGKSNLTEWSNFMNSEALSGYSSFGGMTVNPHNLNMSASGSSTGSAVAVAAGYAPLAIGAEFDGSIIAPASVNGVVGLKPTVGLIGRSGVIPIGFTRDSLGPIGKTVEDVAIALEVLAGVDPNDPGRLVGAATAPWAAFDTDPTPAPGAGDYTSGLTAEALQGARIGVLGNFRDEPVLDLAFGAFDAILPLLEEAGAILVPDILISDDGVGDTYVNSGTEFAWGVQNYLNEFTPAGPMTTIQDIVDYNTEHADEMGDFSGLTDALTPLALDDPLYVEVTTNNTTAMRSSIDSVMDDNDLDAIIAPTASVAGPIDDREFGSTSGLTSIAGYPSLTIPIGTVDGLPVGIHFFGRAFGEAQLLAYAYALEQLLPARVLPAFVPRET